MCPHCHSRKIRIDGGYSIRGDDVRLTGVRWICTNCRHVCVTFSLPFEDAEGIHTVAQFFGRFQ